MTTRIFLHRAASQSPGPGLYLISSYECAPAYFKALNEKPGRQQLSTQRFIAEVKLFLNFQKWPKLKEMRFSSTLRSLFIEGSR